MVIVNRPISGADAAIALGRWFSRLSAGCRELPAEDGAQEMALACLSAKKRHRLGWFRQRARWALVRAQARARRQAGPERDNGRPEPVTVFALTGHDRMRATGLTPLAAARLFLRTRMEPECGVVTAAGVRYYHQSGQRVAEGRLHDSAHR
jgi:hypothetical protein